MAQSRSFFDDVQKELECSVCQEQFSEVNEPKILKCLHTFCKTCLEAWLRQQRKGELSCPTCRQITECPNNNIQSLPSNLFYKQMVEIVEAYDGQGQDNSPHCGSCDEKKTLKFYCSDCNCFLCEDCAGAHKKMKILSSHHVKEIANFVSSDMQDYARKTNICKKHKDELRFYCHKCNICICRDCAMLEHRDHDFISFDQALENKKSEIEKKMQEVEENCSRLRNRKESLEKRNEIMNNSIDQAANKVHRGAEFCINLIRQHEATMTEELLKQKASLQDSFSAEMTALNKKMMEIDSSLEFGKDVIARNNLSEILNVGEILEERFKELSSLPDEFCVELNFSGVKYVPIDMSALKKALAKFCFTNTEPSLSIAQDMGLTDGRLGEDSTFAIITKDSQGHTTYSQNDEVNVDIKSLETGMITKPSITDNKDGCYKVTYKPETPGEFSVSITVAGEAIMGSPFQLRVEESETGQQVRSSNICWEVPRENITIEKVIGHARLGQVAQGTASQLRGREGKTAVAIQMLKASATESERKVLLSELEIMKTFKPHPNVIKLLGCVTESDPILVITEYAPYGNLLVYLRENNGMNANQASLTSQQLMKFSLHIAEGMRYLSSRNIIHGDVAARNMLVGEQETCKVSDFKMAIDVHQENIYITTKEKYPVKWASYETIARRHYTRKSDVWSFGILLCEIFTFGRAPYPGMTNRKVIELLSEGYRMPKPNLATDALYQIMLKCWQEDPDNRPTFENLTCELKQMMENQR